MSGRRQVPGVKRRGVGWQVRLRGPDGREVSATFDTQDEVVPPISLVLATWADPYVAALTRFRHILAAILDWHRGRVDSANVALTRHDIVPHVRR